MTTYCLSEGRQRGSEISAMRARAHGCLTISRPVTMTSTMTETDLFRLMQSHRSYLVLIDADSRADKKLLFMKFEVIGGRLSW